MEKATFGAGCFWHVEEAFSRLPVKTQVGFMGGSLKKPTYKQVCSGDTGHAEVVQVSFGPKVAYKKLLDIFWSIHDPTQLNRQGLDIGSQYRSVIFYHSSGQKKQAEASLKSLQKTIKKEIKTQIKEASPFWKAEEYHQKYFKKHKLLCAVSKILR